MTDNPLIEAVARAAYLSVVGFDPDDIWWDEDEAETYDSRLHWPDNLKTSVNADGYRNAATAALRAIKDAGHRVVKA